MSSENLILLSSENFNDEVMNADKPVIIDFYADWCGPCQMLAPVMDELADELVGKVKVCKLNVDGERDLARKYKVMSIPTILFFNNGELKEKSIGLSSKEEILNIINNML